MSCQVALYVSIFDGVDGLGARIIGVCFLMVDWRW